MVTILFIKLLISNFSLRSRVAPRLKRYRARRSESLLKSPQPSSHRFARRTASTAGRRKIAESSAVNNLRVVSRRSFLSFFFFLSVEGQKRVGRLESRARNAHVRTRCGKNGLSTVKDRETEWTDESSETSRNETGSSREEADRENEKERERESSYGRERQTDRVFAR